MRSFVKPTGAACSPDHYRPKQSLLGQLWKEEPEDYLAEHGNSCVSRIYSRNYESLAFRVARQRKYFNSVKLSCLMNVDRSWTRWDSYGMCLRKLNGSKGCIRAEKLQEESRENVCSPTLRLMADNYLFDLNLTIKWASSMMFRPSSYSSST